MYTSKKVSIVASTIWIITSILAIIAGLGLGSYALAGLFALFGFLSLLVWLVATIIQFFNNKRYLPNSGKVETAEENREFYQNLGRY